MVEFNREEFWKRYIEAKNKGLGYPEFDPKIETFDKYVERYFKEVELPVKEEKKSVLDMFGLSLFRKMSAFFTMMWENVFDALHKSMSSIISDVFKFAIAQFTLKATPRVKEKLKEMYANIGLPEDRKLQFFDEIDKGTPMDYVTAYVYAITSGLFKLTATMSASHEKGRQEQYKLLQPSLPGVADIFNAKFRDKKYEPVIDEYMMKMGFNPEVREMIKLVSYMLLNPEQIRQLFLRGEITKTEKDNMLKQLGIRPEDIDKIEKLYYFIPSPTDLVRMSVREAFYPDYIAKYNLLAELPGEFVEWAKKQGMSPFWAEKFWVSHWVLPSIMQGYEMLHRGVISMDDLNSLFRAVDIAPYWRDKLLKISYSPYTRIDIRRMYRTGVVSEEEVYKNYLALGYDKEHARKITEFTVKDALGSERDLSKSEVIGIYQRKLITREEARQFIIELKYSSEETELYLKRADLDSFKKEKDKKLSWIKRNYISGQITFDDARARLGKLNLRGSEVTELFADWDIEKDGKMTELTFRQLQVLHIKNIIDEATFRSELANKGYSTTNIERLYKLTKMKVVEGE